MYSLLKAKRDDNVRLLDNCDSHKRNQNKILKEKKTFKTPKTPTTYWKRKTLPIKI